MKKIIAIASILAFVLSALTGCGAASNNDKQTVKIGVTGAIYEEIWAPAVAKLKDEGITVELVQFSDFALPNNALDSGDIQMNAFQHHAYFENDKATNGYDISILCDTFVISMNLFSSKYGAPEEIPEGAKVAVPNDATNYGRALLLLEAAGLLELADDAGATPEAADVVSSRVELLEVNASMTYQYVDDSEVAAAVVNGNYAASYDVDPDTAIFYENIDLSDNSFTCVIAVRAEDAENELYKKVAEAFCSEDTEKLFDQEFKGFFVPAWN